MAFKQRDKRKHTQESSEALKNFHDAHYKELMLIPIALFVIAIIILSINYATTGEVISRGISLKGGISITFNKQIDMSRAELQKQLSSRYPETDLVVRELKSVGVSTSYIVEAALDESQVEEFMYVLEDIIGPLGEEQYSVETISSSLSKNFFTQVVKALLWAFILMAIVVFIIFKDFVPSISVIISAVSDIVVTLALTNFLGFKISTAGIAAFLMLIGYSVDSDILLVTRMTKRKVGAIFDRIKLAFSTGMTMSITTLTAVGLAFLLSGSDVIRQIMAIVFLGIMVDLINTWILNVGILRLHLERKK